MNGIFADEMQSCGEFQSHNVPPYKGDRPAIVFHKTDAFDPSAVRLESQSPTSGEQIARFKPGQIVATVETVKNGLSRFGKRGTSMRAFCGDDLASFQSAAGDSNHREGVNPIFNGLGTGGLFSSRRILCTATDYMRWRGKRCIGRDSDQIPYRFLLRIESWTV